jgi:amino acid permease
VNPSWLQGLSLVVYLTVGLAGYLAFGASTAGDVLENFAPSYALAIGAVRVGKSSLGLH